MSEALLAPLGSHEQAAEHNLVWAGRLWSVLQANGLAHVALCPGSRSAPLALAAWGRGGLPCSVHHDERSAAFVALGVARATGRPAAVLTTSGTAAANLAPAAAEAKRAGLPLVLVTADRPAGKRQAGASQVIPQVGLFANLALEGWDLPQPGTASLDELGQLVARAAAIAQGAPSGPVHLNQPLDEPLWPPKGLDPARAGEAEGLPRATPARLAPAHWPAEAQARFAAALRPILLAGPDAVASSEEALALLAWAEAQGLPVLAEATSGLRVAGALAPIRRGDAILAAGWPGLGPDFVIRLGLPPVGKRLERALASGSAPHLVLLGDQRPAEPFGRATWLLAGPVAQSLGLGPAASEATRLARGPWLGLWQRAEAAIEAMEAQASPALGHAEAALALAAVGALPPGALLVLGNSLPIRHVESFGATWAQGVRCLGIRGAAGIDGVTSQALGMALASGRPTLLLTGDVAFLHDLTALLGAPWLGQAGASLVVVVLNNDGGGIFQLLPVAQAAEAGAFEALFGTPHGRDLSLAARALGVEATRVADPEALGLAVAAAMAQGPGLRVVEAVSQRHDTALALGQAVALWKQAMAEVVP